MYLLPDVLVFVLSLAIEQSDSGTFKFQELLLSESFTPPVEENFTLEQPPLKLYRKVSGKNHPLVGSKLLRRIMDLQTPN